MTTNFEDLIEFVDKLLEDWVANELMVNDEHSVSDEDDNAIAQVIQARRAVWEEFKDVITKEG
jgi:hypothetical protein